MLCFSSFLHAWIYKQFWFLPPNLPRNEWKQRRRIQFPWQMQSLKWDARRQVSGRLPTWNGCSSVCFTWFQRPPTWTRDCELNTVRCRPETGHNDLSLLSCAFPEKNISPLYSWFLSLFTETACLGQFQIGFMQFFSNFSATCIFGMTFIASYFTIRRVHYFLIVVNLECWVRSIPFKSKTRVGLGKSFFFWQDYRITWYFPSFSLKLLSPIEISSVPRL